MKKTLIAFVAASAFCAIARANINTVEDAFSSGLVAQGTLSSTTVTPSTVSPNTTVDFSSYTDVNGEKKLTSISVVLDAQSLKSVMIQGADSVKYVPFTLSATGGNGTDAITVGICTNYSSSGGKINTSGLYGYYQVNDGVITWNSGIGTLTCSSTDFWTDVAKVVVTVTKPAAAGLGIYVAFADSKGNVLKSFNNDESGMKFSNSTFTALNLNSDFVTDYYVFNDVLDSTIAGAVTAKVASIPEPTTATLSLLALAGLAARRRRK